MSQFIEPSWVFSPKMPFKYEEVFRESIPWLDSSLSLVASRRTDGHGIIPEQVFLDLKAKRIDNLNGPVTFEVVVHRVCSFQGGDVEFHLKTVNLVSDMTDAERLCFSTLAKGTDPLKVAKALKDPFWQYVLDHFKAAYVMES